MVKRRLAAILVLDVVEYSRMMQADSKGLLAALNVIYRRIVTPAVARNDGRVAKLLGDGALIEFASAASALQAAVAIQRAMRAPMQSYRFHERIAIRAGLHIGDVMVEGDDVFGDAVNIAARLQAAAKPGSILASRTFCDLAGGDHSIRLRREGVHSFKGIAQPVEVVSVDLTDAEIGSRRAAFAREQKVQFYTGGDGARLAWTENGSGPPIVKAANWINHLELDWRNPGLAPIITTLAARYRLVRADARVNGLSDWEVGEISFELFVDDLERLFDTAGVERAPILALSQGAAIAVAFAARRPERVSAIFMLGSFPQGRAKRGTQRDNETASAFRAMMAAGWDDEYPSFRDLLAQILTPSASEEERRRYAEDMRQMVSPENLERFREVIDHVDVTSLLSQVSAPCFVGHCRSDRMQPIDQGRNMAAGLPNAHFVAYDSDNHLVPENDPAWPLIERDLLAFLDEHAD